MTTNTVGGVVEGAGGAGLIVLDAQAAAQLATALTRNRQDLDRLRRHRNSAAPVEHPNLTRLFDLAVSVAIHGQHGRVGGMRAHNALVIDTDAYITPATAAALAGVSERTIRRRINAGDLTATHDGRRPLVLRTAL